MQGFGERIRRRARELGLSDSEVARRAGIEASKFGKYVRNIHEPDFLTFLQICSVLDVTPNDLLIGGEGTETPTEHQRLLALITGTCATLPESELRVVARMLLGMGQPTPAF